MTLREKIGKLPVWKAAIVLILAFVFLLAAIEEIFVSRVFYFMDKTISYFEIEKKKEAEEWEKDEKTYAEFNKKWQQGFDELDKKLTDINNTTKQHHYCLEYLQIQKAREYLRQHQNDPKDIIAKSWEKDQNERLKTEGKSHRLIDLENAIKSKEFDPTKCKREVS
ncbi:MAG TPA: hypothetical protein VFF04_06135 [Candidatus Babeliales bacterium]|nr:hypothetical protein [Candidatus Babeliales bacterium]